MKKSFLFIAILLLLATTAYAQYSARYPSVVNATLMNQIPDPIGPGEIVELNFRVENLGDQVANNVEVEILPEFPFSLRPGDSAARDIGSIQSQGRGEDGVTVRYRLLVDQDATDGYHEIRLRYRDEESFSWATTEPFLIKVQSSVAIISITKVTTNPISIAPGDKAKVTIELRNYASSLLKDVIVRLDLSAASLSPFGSANERVISSIPAQQSAKAEFELMADPGAVAGILKIPISISYSDATGRNYSKSNTISLMVGDTPDITVSLDRSDIYSSGEIGNIVVRVVNRGTTDVKFMTVSIQPPQGAEVIGSSESYIGNLDSDDFSTAEFKLYVKDAKQSVELPIIIEYKDANNNNYRKEASLPLKLYEGKEAKMISGKSGGSMVWIIVIVLAVVGFFVYRRWKKRKATK